MRDETIYFRPNEEGKFVMDSSTAANPSMAGKKNPDKSKDPSLGSSHESEKKEKGKAQAERVVNEMIAAALAKRIANDKIKNATKAKSRLDTREFKDADMRFMASNIGKQLQEEIVAGHDLSDENFSLRDDEKNKAENLVQQLAKNDIHKAVFDLYIYNQVGRLIAAYRERVTKTQDNTWNVPTKDIGIVQANVIEQVMQMPEIMEIAEEFIQKRNDKKSKESYLNSLDAETIEKCINPLVDRELKDMVQIIAGAPMANTETTKPLIISEKGESRGRLDIAEEDTGNVMQQPRIGKIGFIDTDAMIVKSPSGQAQKPTSVAGEAKPAKEPNGEEPAMPAEVPVEKPNGKEPAKPVEIPAEKPKEKTPEEKFEEAYKRESAELKEIVQEYSDTLTGMLEKYSWEKKIKANVLKIKVTGKIAELLEKHMADVAEKESIAKYIYQSLKK